MSIFEHASRIKLRFSTSSGAISPEDLWDLPLQSTRGLNLKQIATTIQQELNAQPSKELDFFESNESSDPILQLKFDIVKHIVTTKVAENKAKSEEKVKESQRAHIQSIIAEKRNEDLKSKSIEELEAMLS